MIWEQIKKFIVGFLLGTAFGAYGVMHIDEVANGYATVRDRIINSVHREPNCPETWTCEKKVETIPTN